MKLPNAPAVYDQHDQDQLRTALEDWMTRQEQRLSGWQDWTGTADRTAHDADAPPTVTQLGQALKALLDDLKG